MSVTGSDLHPKARKMPQHFNHLVENELRMRKYRRNVAESNKLIIHLIKRGRILVI